MALSPWSVPLQRGAVSGALNMDEVWNQNDVRGRLQKITAAFYF
ncbi:hypothetical protein [Comamonas terrigena]|nr:hypothetical protein [Comamonas terrigena]MDH0049932.1 hypothetical protein [Comamonas terrigena]